MVQSQISKEDVSFDKQYVLKIIFSIAGFNIANVLLTEQMRNVKKRKKEKKRLLFIQILLLSLQFFNKTPQKSGQPALCVINNTFPSA